jgi:hypothetical protein
MGVLALASAAARIIGLALAGMEVALASEKCAAEKH